MNTAGMNPLALPFPPVFRNPAARLEEWLWAEQMPPGEFRPRCPTRARGLRDLADVHRGPTPGGAIAARTLCPPQELPPQLRAAQE